jgi:pimeloyl-ACP methyl ester carboxylesterase
VARADSRGARSGRSLNEAVLARLLDRDSNMPGQVLNVAPALASALAARGIASLRFDKRSVGESGGDYLTTGFDLETSDAAAAVAELRRAPGIDSGRVTVIGHSVGATVAIRVGSRDHRLAGVVLLAAACRTGEEVMRRQSERIAASLTGVSRLFRGRFLRRQERARRTLTSSKDDVVRIGKEELPARWFREYMAYDPARDLPSISCPVLAVTDRKDLQVDPDDVERIGALVTAAFAGDTPDELTHILRLHPGPPSLASYPAQLKKPVDAGLLEQVAAWTAGGRP